MSQSPRPTDATLRQQVQELKTMVQCLTQHPHVTPDTPPHGWQRTWTSTECWICGAQGQFNATALKASKIGFVHRPLGHSSHLRNVWEMRHCRVPGPEPNRPPNTKAHLPFSKNRCCGRWQKWPVCQWNCERDTGSVSSGYGSKYHYHLDPVVEGHCLQSSVNTKPTWTCYWLMDIPHPS